jgi:UDP:flavonoid glycosyltransferase YjiC (YdhE family)
VSRIVFCWELGSNLGHLSRLLPLALELRGRGHEILVAVRDVTLATELLAPSGLPFVQAPRTADAPQDGRHPASYADMLLLQGWGNSAGLWGAVQAWGNLLRLAGASAVVIDYSPAALLTARIMNLPSAVLGTGFELPPLEIPLPAFPGAAVAAAEFEATEIRVLASANEVLKAYGGRRLEALRDLFQTERRWLTTFAELDQYGARAAETYVGPIGSVDRAEPASWPDGFSHRVLAYLRPNTPGLKEILTALASRSDAAAICVAPGLSAESLGLPSRAGFQLFSRPVRFPSLLSDASLFVSYGPAASVTHALLKGIPQLIAPAHVEAQMTAVRVLAMGAGLTLRREPTLEGIQGALARMLSDARFKVRALEFAARHRDFDAARTVARLVTDIEALAAGACPRSAVA